MDAEESGPGAGASVVLPRLVDQARELVDELAPELTDLSHHVHGHPELRFEEKESSAAVGRLLAAHGFDLTPGVGGMPTAFWAERRFGAGGPTVAVFCEYDALEGIGHACGHNIIAAAGAGAAIAAAGMLDTAGPPVNGRVVAIGSPGEEGGGGKVRLIDAGLLGEVDAAVMVHPAGFDAVARPNLGRVSLQVTFAGRASHAAAAPEVGLNALDAATLLLVSIGLLRQQLRSDSRVHAIIVDGGDAVNVIPERAELKVFVRSPDLAYLRQRLEPAIRACAEGAALATGTTVEVRESAPAYEPIRSNPVLAHLASEALGLVDRPHGAPRPPGESAGSTDMGNVSQILPAIHPYLCVLPGLSIHTREFAAAAGGPAGDRAVLDGATVLGAVIAALLGTPGLVGGAKAAFEDTVPPSWSIG